MLSLWILEMDGTKSCTLPSGTGYASFSSFQGANLLPKNEDVKYCGSFCATPDPTHPLKIGLSMLNHIHVENHIGTVSFWFIIWSSLSNLTDLTCQFAIPKKKPALQPSIFRWSFQGKRSTHWKCCFTTRYTLENEHLEPKNGGLVQMIFLFNWLNFRFQLFIFRGVSFCCHNRIWMKHPVFPALKGKRSKVFTMLQLRLPIIV